MATTNATPYTLAVPRAPISRDLVEVILGFSAILAVLWLPTPQQLIFGPIALLAPLALVLTRRTSPFDLGLGWQAFVSSLWILPAALALSIFGILAAQKAGTFHGLYQADFAHIGGYVLWTIYQQFLLQDYFMPRLTRVVTSDVAVAIAGVLFAVAHLPNQTLTIATLMWGAASCLQFRRYRSLYVLGLAQGLLGLCFAVCVPDAMHHHMRVGLGYWQYHPQLVQAY